MSDNEATVDDEREASLEVDSETESEDELPSFATTEEGDDVEVLTDGGDEE